MRMMCKWFDYCTTQLNHITRIASDDCTGVAVDSAQEDARAEALYADVIAANPSLKSYLDKK